MDTELIPKQSNSFLSKLWGSLQILVRFLFVSPGVFRLIQKIIDARAVKIGKFDEHIRGDIVLSRLVFGISRLGQPEHFCDLRLRQVSVFAQIADPSIHTYSFLRPTARLIMKYVCEIS